MANMLKGFWPNGPQDQVSTRSETWDNRRGRIGNQRMSKREDEEEARSKRGKGYRAVPSTLRWTKWYDWGFGSFWNRNQIQSPISRGEKTEDTFDWQSPAWERSSLISFVSFVYSILYRMLLSQPIRLPCNAQIPILIQALTHSFLSSLTSISLSFPSSRLLPKLPLPQPDQKNQTLLIPFQSLLHYLPPPPIITITM